MVKECGARKEERMDPKEFNRRIAGVKREIGNIRRSIYEVIGYGEDAESELNELESKLKELEKEVETWKEENAKD